MNSLELLTIGTEFLIGGVTIILMTMIYMLGRAFFSTVTQPGVGTNSRVTHDYIEKTERLHIFASYLYFTGTVASGGGVLILLAGVFSSIVT